MKKIISLIAVMLISVCLGCTVSADEAALPADVQIYLEDNADIYSDAEEALVRKKLTDAAMETGWCYGIYTTKEFDYDPDRYGESQAYVLAGRKAEEIYKEVFGADKSGILFFCDVGYRYTVIANDAEQYIVGKRFDNLNSAMKDKYFDYDDMGVVNVLTTKTVEYYKRGPGSSDITVLTVVIPLVIAVIISVIACAVVASNYKSLEKPDTRRYLAKNHTNIYKKVDRIVSTRNYSYSNSSGSGGGHGGGGGFSGGSFGGGGFGGHR